MAWKKEQVTKGTLRQREWLKTEGGIAYLKRNAEKKKLWREANKDKDRQIQKRSYTKARLEALQHYSGKDVPECACCGESGFPFLTLDHIDGDGAERRRSIGMAQGDSAQVKRQKQTVSIGGNGFVYWLKKNHWPTGIQVLCANCNFAKRTHAECPHQAMKRRTE